MTDIQAWLDHGKTLADKTIPGPWVSEWVEDDDWHEIHGQPFDGMVCPQVATIQGGGENEAAFIADSRTRLPQALNALQSVLDLHKPVDVEPSETICAVCSTRLPNGRFMPTVEHPCPTVLAITDAIKEQDA